MNKLDFSHITQRPKTAPTTKITNQRQYWVKQFVDTLNSYVTPPYKPVNPKRIAVLLSPIKTENLGMFYGECNYSKHFAKFFYWSCNPKKHNPQAK